MIRAFIRQWLAKRLGWLHDEWHDDPVWFMGRPWTPEQLDAIENESFDLSGVEMAQTRIRPPDSGGDTLGF